MTDQENESESIYEIAFDKGYTEAVEYLDNEVCPDNLTAVYGVLSIRMREFRATYGYSFRLGLHVYGVTESEAHDIGFMMGLMDYGEDRFPA